MLNSFVSVLLVFGCAADKVRQHRPYRVNGPAVDLPTYRTTHVDQLNGPALDLPTNRLQSH